MSPDKGISENDFSVYKTEKPAKEDVMELSQKSLERDWQERIGRYFRGETHAHSDLSDEYNRQAGKKNHENAHQIKRLLNFYAKQSLDFAVIAEHASDPGDPRLLEAGDPICLKLIEQARMIKEERAKGQPGVETYAAVEASIFYDAENQPSLDLPPELLEQMDLVIASRHKIKDEKDPEKIQASLLMAVNHPEVDIIGHPFRHVEFYPHDWNFFKKYWRKDPELSARLETLDKQGLRKIIGKEEVTDRDDIFIQENRERFAQLEKEYWQMWDTVLAAMAKQGKVFEINLNSFVPSKSFYQILLKRAAAYPDLKFAISFDFHNLDQQDSFPEKDFKTARLPGVKSPARNKAYRKLLDLIELLEENEIGPNRIINSSRENFQAFLER